MSQVLIRDVDESVLKKLKQMAKNHNRSLQSELHIILTEAANYSVSNAAKTAAKIRKKLENRQHSDSAQLIMEDRQR